MPPYETTTHLDVKTAVERRPFEDPTCQNILDDVFRSNDSITPLFVSRPEWETLREGHEGAYMLAKTPPEVGFTLTLPTDLKLWEIVDVVRLIDNATFEADKPEEVEKHQAKLRERGKMFCNVGIYIAQYGDGHSHTSMECAHSFYNYGGSILSGREQNVQVGSIQAKKLSLSAKMQTDYYLATGQLLPVENVRLINRHLMHDASLTPEEVAEASLLLRQLSKDSIYRSVRSRISGKAQLDRQRRKKVRQYFRTMDKAYELRAKTDWEKPQEVHPALRIRGIHETFIEQQEEQMDRSVDSLLRELDSAIWRRGMMRIRNELGFDKFISELTDLYNRKRKNRPPISRQEEQRIDQLRDVLKNVLQWHHEENTLREALHLDQMKAELDQVRENPFTAEVAIEFAEDVMDAGRHISRSILLGIDAYFAKNERDLNPADKIAYLAGLDEIPKDGLAHLKEKYSRNAIISRKELECARKIQRAIAAYKRILDSDAYRIAQVIDRQAIDCVSASALGTSFLSELNINHVVVSMTRHSSFMIATSNKQVVYHDMLSERANLNFPLSDEMVEGTMKNGEAVTVSDINDFIEHGSEATMAFTLHPGLLGAPQTRVSIGQADQIIKSQYFFNQGNTQFDSAANESDAAEKRRLVEEIINYSQKSIDSDPLYAPPHVLLGLALRERAHMEPNLVNKRRLYMEALEPHDRAKKLDPYLLQPYFNIANIFCNLAVIATDPTEFRDLLEKAIVEYETTQKLAPRASLPHNYRANVYKWLAEKEDAHEKRYNLYEEALNAYAKYFELADPKVEGELIQTAQAEVERIKQKLLSTPLQNSA